MPGGRHEVAEAVTRAATQSGGRWTCRTPESTSLAGWVPWTSGQRSPRRCQESPPLYTRTPAQSSSPAQVLRRSARRRVGGGGSTAYQPTERPVDLPLFQNRRARRFLTARHAQLVSHPGPRRSCPCLPDGAFRARPRPPQPPGQRAIETKRHRGGSGPQPRPTL